MHRPKPEQWPTLPRGTLREQIYPWALSRASSGRNTKGCQQYLPLETTTERNQGVDLTVRNLLHRAEALLP